MTPRRPPVPLHLRLRSALLREDVRAACVVFLVLAGQTAWIYHGHPSAPLRPAIETRLDASLWAWTGELHRYVFALVTWLCVPMWVARRLLRLGWRDVGFTLGDWRAGLRILLPLLVIVPPLLWIGTQDAALVAEYPKGGRAVGDSVARFVLWELTYVLYYVAWEGANRGLLFLGIARTWGPIGAAALSMFPVVLLHIGKPEGETFGALLTAPAFAWYAWRTRSILWPLLIHWYTGAMTDLLCLIRKG